MKRKIALLSTFSLLSASSMSTIACSDEKIDVFKNTSPVGGADFITHKVSYYKFKDSTYSKSIDTNKIKSSRYNGAKISYDEDQDFFIINPVKAQQGYMYYNFKSKNSKTSNTLLLYINAIKKDNDEGFVHLNDIIGYSVAFNDINIKDLKNKINITKDELTNEDYLEFIKIKLSEKYPNLKLNHFEFNCYLHWKEKTSNTIKYDVRAQIWPKASSQIYDGKPVEIYLDFYEEINK